jgi:hypothetical protein
MVFGRGWLAILWEAAAGTSIIMELGCLSSTADAGIQG